MYVMNSLFHSAPLANSSYSALGAVSHPKLFSAVILIDPVMINPKEPPELDWALKGAIKTLVRKDTWESKCAYCLPDTSEIIEFQNCLREQAYVEFSSSPYYKSWDLDVLMVYVDSALYETTVTTTTGVTKTTAKTKITPFHEALVFFGGDVPKEAFVSLRNLSESVSLHWIVSGAQGAPQFGPPGSQHERVWLRSKNSSNTIIKKAGHLVCCSTIFDGFCLVLIRVSCADTSGSACRSR